MSAQASGKQEAQVHYLPCSIRYDGPAPIQSFMHIEQSTTHPNELTTTFRGRELHGRKVIVPDGVSAVWVRPGRGSKLDIVDAVTTIHVWEHGVAPDVSCVTDYLQWLDIAKAVSISLAYTGSIFSFLAVDTLYGLEDRVHFLALESRENRQYIFLVDNIQRFVAKIFIFQLMS